MYHQYHINKYITLNRMKVSEKLSSVNRAHRAVLEEEHTDQDNFWMDDYVLGEVARKTLSYIDDIELTMMHIEDEKIIERYIILKKQINSFFSDSLLLTMTKDEIISRSSGKN